ncbi:MAG: hypothetical protein DMF57_18120 [Acidobacteria bacterium]|nr:MAG: hypothetical protein DMF57_18120 [Acidobacteriota bacterium]
MTNYGSAKARSSAKDLIGAGLNHAVQFYEEEEVLYSTVADFLADGLLAGEPVVVIATEPHRLAFVASLEGKGVGTEGMILLDAREMLDTFMVGTMPDEQRFRASIGGVIEKAAASRRKLAVRAYGEMVDVLWRDGNPEAAIALEELWNDLANLYTFALLCAYPIGNIYKEAHSPQFEKICSRHTHVIPGLPALSS